MRCTTTVPDRRIIRFTVPQALQLVSLLEQRLEQDDGLVEMAQLRAMQDRVEDALWAARWLREDVQLEATQTEGSELARSLSTRRCECETPRDAQELLTRIVGPLDGGAVCSSAAAQVERLNAYVGRERPGRIG